MKKLIFLSILAIISNHLIGQDYIPNVEGNYLGQAPPKDSAIIFAPGIVSQNNRYEYALSISPSHDEIFYGVEQPEDSTEITGLLTIKRDGDRWEQPKIANLNGQGLWEQEAFFSPNGKEIYYAVYLNDSMGLWKSVKEGNNWSKGVELSPTVNKSSRIIFYSTVSNNLNLYYMDVIKRKILMSKLENGKYEKIIDPGISQSGHPFIAPDESFMLIDAVVNKEKRERDIFIVYKNADGTWGEPINLGPQVNSEYSETCPSLSPGGKYIFFARYNDLNNKSDIYWISSEILKNTKP